MGILMPVDSIKYFLLTNYILNATRGYTTIYLCYGNVKKAYEACKKKKPH